MGEEEMKEEQNKKLNTLCPRNDEVIISEILHPDLDVMVLEMA